MHGAIAKTLAQILDDSGIAADNKMAAYLTHIGVKQPSQFALMFKDTEAVNVWCQKFRSKVTFGDQEIHITEDDQHTAMTGAITAAFIECQCILRQQQQASMPAHPPPTPALTATPGTTPPSLEDKVPKTWPAGEYQRLIKQYHDNSGSTRHFPEKMVLGAERILVRMWHEHHKSKNYTAVTLGEIITNRTFTATGTVNSTVKRDRLDKTLTIDTSNNTLIQQEAKDWDPQTSMMILDALEAIQWAWTLIQIGTEGEITTYIERFKTLTRRNAHRLPNIKALWDTFAWEIAVHMRTSSTFGQITSDLLSDPVQLADILSPTHSPRNRRARKAMEKARQKRRRRPLGTTTLGTTTDSTTTTGTDHTKIHTRTTNITDQHQEHITSKTQPFPPAPPPPAALAAPYIQYQADKGKGKNKGKHNNTYKGHKGQGKNKQ